MKESNASVRIRATRAKVFAAFLDGNAMGRWLRPDGMKNTVHAFDSRLGGLIRMTIEPVGKPEQGRTFHLIVAERKDDRKIVYKCAFESFDPGLAGESRLTFNFLDADGGTEVRMHHEGLPPAVSEEDDSRGSAMSLANLAKLVEKGGKPTAKAKKGASPAQKLIKALGLEPLPGEGGFFKETYRSMRKHGTAIYYLVTPSEFSALHRLKSDEIFHFYAGDPVEMLQLEKSGQSRIVVLGGDVLKGQRVQATVPAGVWQGTRLKKGGSYALLGTTVFPAFEFSDFELGQRARLIARYPRLARQIERFTRV